MLDKLANQQAGVLSRRQVLAAGRTPGWLRARLDSGQWQVLFGGTYATYSGPVTRASRLWAAVLHGGPSTVLSHQSAAEVSGLVDEPVDPIHVTVPHSRRVRRQPGLIVHRTDRVIHAAHPTRIPPQTRIEETVVDLVQRSTTLDRAVGWITRACGRRLTTVDRILAALCRRGKVRWRRELAEALGDVRAGCHSVLERRYLALVEQAHWLPVGSRQHHHDAAGRRTYDDVRYDRWGLVVELDGRAEHAGEHRWRDMRRDNRTVVSGRTVLRYGWGDVVERPCAVAEQVALVLRRGGWGKDSDPGDGPHPGKDSDLGDGPRRCGPACRLRQPDQS